MTGTELTVRRYGSAGPLVLRLHGGPGAPGELAPVSQRLGSRCRVLEPFERRSGNEPLSVAVHVGDLAQLVREASAWNAAVIGFSSGAITALTLASSYPELCCAVVLVGSATLTAEARSEFKRRLEERLDPPTSTQLAELHGMPETDQRLGAQAALVSKAYLIDAVAPPEHVWIDARGHRETWRDMLRLQEIGEHPAAFRSIDCPVLMIHGADDPHPGKVIRDSLRAAIPHLEYVELPACGHYPWLERAVSEEFYEILENWLTKHEPA